MLRSGRHKVGENIQVYADRILSLEEEAFAGQGGNAVERQLIDTFVDGLVNNDQLKMKLELVFVKHYAPNCLTLTLFDSNTA